MNETQITTKTIQAQIVNGFVTGGIGGNPAGVVLDADELSENEMLSIVYPGCTFTHQRLNTNFR